MEAVISKVYNHLESRGCGGNISFGKELCGKHEFYNKSIVLTVWTKKDLIVTLNNFGARMLVAKCDAYTIIPVIGDMMVPVVIVCTENVDSLDLPKETKNVLLKGLLVHELKHVEQYYRDSETFLNTTTGLSNDPKDTAYRTDSLEVEACIEQCKYLLSTGLFDREKLKEEFHHIKELI